jgi:Staphylococcal nuclease homologue
MSTEPNAPQVDWNQFSPATMWRDWIVKSEAQWSETVSQLLKDERGGGVLKKQVDEARMAHRQFGEMAQAALAAAYLPTRSDIEAIDERMGKLEDGLAQVSAQIVALREALVAQGAAKIERVPRTRKAPKKTKP